MYRVGRDCLLLFGIEDADSSAILDTMIEYSLSDGLGLVTLNLSNYMAPPDILMTMDERYILIIGATLSQHYSDRIKVIDMREKQASESGSDYSVKSMYLVVPCNDIEEMQYKENVVRTFGGYKHDLLVDGWIRNLYQLSEFEGVKMVSKDVVSLLLLWLRKEMIHWIGREAKTKQHFAAFVDDILEPYND